MAANSEEEPMHVEENNVESSSDASASDLKLAECIDTPITSVTPSSTSGNNIQFDQRGSYTKLLCQSYKIHQLCILSSIIQWCYPKY